MKKTILILFSIVLLMTFAYADKEITFDPSSVDVDMNLVKETYKAKLPNLSFSQADGIAGDILAHTGTALFLDDQNLAGDKVHYKNADNSAVCQINKTTGDVFFRKYSKVKGATPNLPKRSNAVNVAKKHLKDLGLWKDKMTEPIVTTLTKATYDGQTTTVYEKVRVVTFRRKIGGMMVKGASRAVVMMGQDGEMEGLIVRWMDLETEKVKGKVAKEQLKDYIKGKFNARQIEGNGIRVKKADLVLYDNGKGVVEPALQIVGDINTAEGAFGSDWMFPVITDAQASY